MVQKKFKTPEYVFKQIYYNAKWRDKDKILPELVKSIHILNKNKYSYLELETIQIMKEFKRWLSQLSYKDEIKDDLIHIWRVMITYLSFGLHFKGDGFDSIQKRWGWSKWKKEIIETKVKRL